MCFLTLKQQQQQRQKQKALEISVKVCPMYWKLPLCTAIAKWLCALPLSSMVESCSDVQCSQCRWKSKMVQSMKKREWFCCTLSWEVGAIVTAVIQWHFPMCVQTPCYTGTMHTWIATWYLTRGKSSGANNSFTKFCCTCVRTCLKDSKLDLLLTSTFVVNHPFCYR